MIHVEKHGSITVKGDLISEIGPELVTIIGSVADSLEKEMGETGRSFAEAFIDICVKSALWSDEVIKKVDIEKYNPDVIAKFMKSIMEEEDES